MDRNRGFTIFEMMITLAIAGVISAFAIPAMQDFMARNRVSALGNELATTLASARNKAVTSRRTVILQLASTGWTLSFDSTTGTQIEVHTIASPLQVTQTNPTTPTVTAIAFLPTGQVQQFLPTAGAALDWTVQICDSSSRREVGRNVAITRIGRIASTSHASAATCNP